MERNQLYREALVVMDKVLAVHTVVAMYYNATRAGYVNDEDRRVCEPWVVGASKEALSIGQHMQRLMTADDVAHWPPTVSHPQPAGSEARIRLGEIEAALLEAKRAAAALVAGLNG
jgi:hypothetical protein